MSDGRPRRSSPIICALTAALLWGSLAPPGRCGEDPAKTREDLKEPILRIAKATPPKTGGHPLDPALDLARNGLKIMQESVQDYTCTMVKRERIDGKLGDYEYMYTKIRNRKVADGKLVSPFSVYMYFLRPTALNTRPPARCSTRPSVPCGSSRTARSPCGASCTPSPTRASRSWC